MFRKNQSHLLSECNLSAEFVCHELHRCRHYTGEVENMITPELPLFLDSLCQKFRCFRVVWRCYAKVFGFVFYQTWCKIRLHST